MLPTFLYSPDIPYEYYSASPTSHLEGINIYKDRTKNIKLSNYEQTELTRKLFDLLQQKIKVYSCSVDQLSDYDFKQILDELHSKVSGQCSKALDVAGFKTVSYLSFYSFSRAKDKICALAEFLEIDDIRLRIGNLTLKTVNGDTFKPIEQTGHNCKITALAMVSHFLSPKTAIPLHKKNGESPTSMRSLAKKNAKSVQGEILSVSALVEVAKASELHDAAAIKPASLKEYRKHVIKSLEQNKPVIAFFLVNMTGWNKGLPIVDDTTIKDSVREEREHACVITRYEPNTDQITITHWGKNYTTTLSDLYKSSQLLKDARTPESYYHYTKTEKQGHSEAKERKWNTSDRIHADKIIYSGTSTRQHERITPQHLNDGFKGMLITFNSASLPLRI